MLKLFALRLKVTHNLQRAAKQVFQGNELNVVRSAYYTTGYKDQ